MEIKEALFHYALRMGDNSLILGHRLSEWCGHGPILEQDIALINVALDLIGQSRSYLSYAGDLEGKGRTEDDLAYLRREREFRNVLLTELPNGDFGRTLVRQFLFDVFHYLQLEELKGSSDEQLAAIATKSLKEVTYHLRYSSEWMIRLGDGTEESHRRVQKPLNDLWAYTGELFEMDEVDETLAGVGIAPDLASLKPAWESKVREILTEATLDVPESGWMHSGGRKGVHSEHLGYLLSELQYLQRSIPNAKW
jgi:ring-1,2-phenylacetyl-CoA epoxidase subunit PaaC